MAVHLIRLPHPMREVQYQFVGSIKPMLEDLLISTIDHFYEVTGSLFAESSAPALYTVYLDAKGGNNFQKQSQIHFNTRNLTPWTVTHELAHSLDSAHGWRLSKQMQKHTGSGFLCQPLHDARPTWKLFWYRVGSPPPPCGVDKNFNALEDFAETVTACIFPEEAHRRAAARGYPYEKWGYGHFHSTPRGKFFSDLLITQKNTALQS